MQLEDTDLEAYVRLVLPAGTPGGSVEERAERLRKLRDAIARGERRLADNCVARDADGELCAALRLAPVGGDSYVLAARPADQAADAETAALVPEAMRRARGLGARSISARPDVGKAGPLYRAALCENGFRELDERIEFKAPVAGLPLDDGTPLRWRDLVEVGEERAAAMLGAVAVGDPTGDEEARQPALVLRDWLGAPELTSGPECVQVGSLDDRAVAFVCVQVSERDGWSRITYMGLVPGARGRGLGKWVHRKGFRMLREQGGKLYHGGTASENEAMLRLFRRHGCREVARMLAFEWSAAGA